ncbi:PhpK family radical SAM P-methyltransferase [Acanthopleuribacter pedis]|uniref:PhpK family radical SAM P-methyltransferase n=1 Tax=Acanthopleuribacter pedis TaxID=442870 RepID=A0A8J7Q449_9BACT|nr:PhpK family radical SAM P-methyltransferase [Acanthopleuribacter pedis]MBO1317341.1 PhpK family radical SAM P-methyltransferase [Acanthopleuribacter pedis]MBO1318648.1 PhpK family radical SAM P-methyltransferase [Acanthopleuribacter pedis]
MKTDVLLIGYNTGDLKDYLGMVRLMGATSGAYRDLAMAVIDVEGQPYDALQAMTHFHYKGREDQCQPFHNTDFLWPTILYLGSFLHKHGHSFDYINLFRSEREQFKQKLLNDEILSVAITTTLYVIAEPVLEIVSFIRQYNQNVKIIIGGPYIGNQTGDNPPDVQQLFFSRIGADVYVDSSEGETALVQTIEALKEGRALAGIDNIIFKDGDQYIVNNKSIERNTLNDNMVNYSLFPNNDIGRFVSLRTAKSCPFSCAFCGFPERAGRYTYLPVDLVEKELDALAELGTVDTITFLDDTFNVPKGRFKKILRMMIKNKYNFHWNSYYRSDHGDEETIALMGEAGCEGVFLGCESGSDTMLKKMNKAARQKDYKKAIPLLRKAGIATHANLIIGFPGETLDTFQETLDFLEEAQPDYFRAQLWYADPITPVWKKREELGIQGGAFNWKHHTMNDQIACDLVEKLFCSVQNSLWMPQYGFELWSTFYLKRRGATLKQVKDFMAHFNAIIRARFMNPGETPHDLIAGMAKAARFDEVKEVAMSPVAVYGGDRYKEAERTWVAWFRAPAPAKNIDRLPAALDAEPREARTEALILTDQTLLAESARLGLDSGYVLAAIYVLMLAELTGHEEVVLVAGLAGKKPVPLRIKRDGEERFADLVTALKKQHQALTAVPLNPFHYLCNRIRLDQHGLAAPTFDVGFYFGSATDGKHLPQAVDGQVGLMLTAEESGGQVGLQFHYKPSWFDASVIKNLENTFTGLLNETTATAGIHQKQLIHD